jgi:hypothetical protein
LIGGESVLGSGSWRGSRGRGGGGGRDRGWRDAEDAHKTGVFRAIGRRGRRKGGERLGDEDEKGGKGIHHARVLEQGRSIEQAEKDDERILCLKDLTLLALALLGSRSLETDENIVLGEEEERRSVDALDDLRESVEAALSDKGRDRLGREMREESGRSRSVGSFLLGSRRLGSVGLAASDVHLGETLVNRGEVACAVLNDGEEEVEKLGSGFGILAQVDEHSRDDRLARDLGEEKESDQRSDAGLVKELDSVSSDRLLGWHGCLSSRSRRSRDSSRTSVLASTSSSGRRLQPCEDRSTLRRASVSAPESRKQTSRKRLKEFVVLFHHDVVSKLGIEAGEEAGWVDVGRLNSGRTRSLIPLTLSSSGSLPRSTGRLDRFLLKDFSSDVGGKGV